jgi:hypothetical protein
MTLVAPEPMEVFNQDLLYACGLSFPYQALVRYNYRNPTIFVALERWRNTTGPVWLIVPKPVQIQKAFEPYQALANRLIEIIWMTFVAPER